MDSIAQELNAQGIWESTLLWAPVNRVSFLGEITQLVPLFMALES